MKAPQRPVRTAGSPIAPRPMYSEPAFGFGTGGNGDNGEGPNLNFGPVDMRGAQDWRAIASKDVSSFKTGSIVIVCNAVTPASIAGAYNTETPHVEVRLVGVVAGISHTWMEQALTGQQYGAVSAGPLRFVFTEEEMPEAIEVWARARRGGNAETVVEADEVLSISGSGRFHT